MIRIAVVEDEEIYVTMLQKYIEQFGQETKETFEVFCFHEAESFLQEYRPEYHIILMDIAMPGMNGLEAARKLRQIDKSVILIFVTNMARYAGKGYEVDAMDFIVKPVNYYDFKIKLKKAIDIMQLNQGTKLEVAVANGVHYIHTERLMYIEVMNHSLIYHMIDGELQTRGSLNKVELQLTGHGFARCNSCYLVNLKYVIYVHNYQVRVGKDELKISKPKRKAFLQTLADWHGGKR